MRITCEACECDPLDLGSFAPFKTWQCSRRQGDYGPQLPML